MSLEASVASTTNLWKLISVFSSFVPFFDKPLSPERMNFLWEISLSMMIICSQWLGPSVHARHDECKHPSKKGCLLSQGVMEKDCAASKP